MTTARAELLEASDELNSLVPRRSAARSLLVALVVVIVLAAAWFSPAVLRPRVHSLGSNAGASVELVETGRLLTITRAVPQAWPSATLTAVDDVAGADVAAVWLLPSDADPLADTDTTGASDPLAVLREAYPDADVQPGGNLPRTFSSGEALHLVILWDIADCAALQAEESPGASLRTALGTTPAPDPLWEANSPGYLLAEDTGWTSALCGAGD